MTHKLPVKEHLRNAALYQSLNQPLHSSEWKRRLLNQYNMQKQLNDALHLKTSIFKLPICIVVPITCLFLVFATHFGLLPLGQWLVNVINIGSLSMIPIGLKEILIFAALVNGLTFLSMKQKFSF